MCSTTARPGVSLEQTGQEGGAAPELIPGRRAHGSRSAAGRAVSAAAAVVGRVWRWVWQRPGMMPCRTKAVTSPAPRGCGSPFSELPPLSDESCSGLRLGRSRSCLCMACARSLPPPLARKAACTFAVCECLPCLLCPRWSQTSPHCVRPEPQSASARLSCLLQSWLQDLVFCYLVSLLKSAVPGLVSGVASSSSLWFA